MTTSQPIVRNTFAADQAHAHTQATETVTAGKGMPARLPQDERARVGVPQTPHDASVEASLALPHERDQSTDMTASKRDPVMVQAERDLRQGIADTSEGVEMGNAYKKLK